jgi:hypothetical protein
MAEEVALHQVAAVLLEQHQLLVGLDPFGHHRHLQAVGHGDDGARDRRVFRVLRQAADEAAVDLQRAHVEAL